MCGDTWAHRFRALGLYAGEEVNMQSVFEYLEKVHMVYNNCA